MEGRPVAVSSTVTLPAQPTAGNVRYIPLGGDGYTSPFAAYNLVGHAVTGAAGGGAAVLTCIMDDRFVSLISYISVADVQAVSADADVSIVLTAAEVGMPTQALSEAVTAISAVVNVGTIRRTWTPPPVLLAGGSKRGQITFSMVNVDTDVYSMSALIYLFNIRVRETTPMGPLLWARGVQ